MLFLSSLVRLDASGWYCCDAPRFEPVGDPSDVHYDAGFQYCWLKNDDGA